MTRMGAYGASAVHRKVSWGGAAFIVESMLLLVFVAASLAVFAQLFAGAASRAVASESLSRAVAVAADAAERFAADPAGASPIEEIDGMVAVSDVTSEDEAHGVLYHATISVYTSEEELSDEGGAVPVYVLSTSRYLGEVAR